MTPASILEALRRVDGRGSKLDADLVRGQVPVFEAPEDGQVYGRQDGGWVPLSVGGGGEVSAAAVAALIAASLAGHVGAADPHPQYALDTDLAGYVSLTGAQSIGGVKTFDDTLIRAETTAEAGVLIRASAGYARVVYFQTGTLNRWSVYAGSDAESGSNAGSNLYVSAFDDAGAFIDNPLSIVRAAGGLATFNRRLSVQAGTATAAALTLTCTGTNGVNLLLAGDGATTPNKSIRVRAGILEIINSAYSTTLLTLTDAGVLTVPQNIASTSTTTGSLVVAGGGGFAGALYVGATLQAGGLVNLVPLTPTADVRVEVGATRSGDGNSYIDLIGDATYTDAGARFIRFAGANGNSEVIHRGTGRLRLVTQDAGDIDIVTSNTARGRFYADGGFQWGGTLGTSPGFGQALFGGTVTCQADLVRSFASGDGRIVIRGGASGTNRILSFQTGAVNGIRWEVLATSAAESGSNAGSAFAINAFTDAGAYIDTPLTIVRAAGGMITLARPVSVTNATASTSTTTGALVVTGGIGVGGQVTATALLVNGGNPSFTRTGAQATYVFVGRDAGQKGLIGFRTGTGLRWEQGVGNGAEGGSNAGSDYEINAYDDAGVYIHTPVQIGRATGVVRLQSVTGTTAAVDTVLLIRNNSTGTPAAGYGSHVLIQLKSSTTANRDGVYLTTQWADATDGTRKARFIIQPCDTAAREAARFEADGAAARISFYGVAAVARQAAAAAATDLASVITLANGLRTILQNLGLAS